MPIGTTQLSDLNFNPKYGRNVWKLTLLSTLLGDIACFVGVHFGTEADSNIWRKDAPWKFMKPLEVCLTDCAYSGQSHVVAPFWNLGLRSLAGAPQAYNELHSYYRARAEHLFALFYPFGLIQHKFHGREHHPPGILTWTSPPSG
jgi:hypothetical protein